MNAPEYPNELPNELPEVEADEQTRLQVLDIFAQVSANLADEDDVEELLGRFLGTMLRLAKASAGAVRVVTTDGKHLRLVAARGLPREVVERERLVPIDCGHCGGALLDEHSRYEIDLRSCAIRTRHPYFGNECQAMVVVPLQHGGRLQGTYNLFLPERFELPEEVALLFRSIGEHLGMALENAHLKRENLRIKLMNERQMMAAEVHDSLAQTLAFMKMRIVLLQDALADASHANIELAGKYASDVGQALDEAYRQLRELLVQFRSRMDPMGLQQALAGIAKNYQDRTGIVLEYCDRVADLRLSVDQEAQVFFIVQEALANVSRHSGATHARLTLEGAGDYYVVTIDDNGRGNPNFTPPSGLAGEVPQLHDHFGLSIMRERARLIGGRVEVANLPEGGFRVRLTFPAIGPNNIKLAS